MRAICAWCRKELPLPEGDWSEQEGVTHGICERCTESQLFGTGGDFHRFLDSLPLPVFVVDHLARIRSANTRACVLVGKPLAEISGLPCGDVLECDNARLPGGCGNTENCSGCLIRRSIMQTFETGHSIEKVPAPLRKYAPGETRSVALLISTEKIGHAVLLRLDEYLPAEDSGL